MFVCRSFTAGCLIFDIKNQLNMEREVFNKWCWVLDIHILKNEHQSLFHS